jgi:hypothetical protein
VASGTDLELLRRYEPVLRFTHGELFLPVSVEDYLAAASLWRLSAGERRPKQVAAPGELTPDRLADLGREHAGEALSLRYVQRPLGARELTAWRRDADRPRFRPSARFAAVGLLGRLIDAVVRLSLLFRGRVPGGTTAAAAVQYRRSQGHDRQPYYARVVRDAGYVVLQYWYFYAMNDWRSSFTGVNDHEADWEQVTLYLPESAEPGQRPAWVAVSSHDELGADLRRRSDDPDITWVGTHPVIYVGAGSHAGAFLPGEYVVSVQPPGIKRLNAGLHHVTNVLTPWAPQRRATTLGIPYVDYRRGDGVQLGPGGRPWTPVLIDDDTDWVRDYRGLWGLDTSDPMGGERAPAGPRYERSGLLRPSWVDPVGWAALDLQSPTPEERDLALEQRLAELDNEIGRTQKELDDVRGRLRRAYAGAEAVARVTGTLAVPEQVSVELDQVRDRLTALREERHAVEETLRTCPPPPHPHAHLQRRPVPDIDPAKTPSRLLHAWSMVSVSVLLLGLAAVFLIQSVTWVAALTALIIGVLLLESLARGRFSRFVLNLAVMLAMLAPLVLLAVAFAWHWRYGVAALLATAAVTLLVANLRDFFAKR